MRAAVHRCALWSAAVALLAASPVSGEPSNGPTATGEDRWVPAFAFTSGVTVQMLEGNARSTCRSGMCSTTPGTRNLPNTDLRPFAQGSDPAVSPYVGGTLQLMSPAIPFPGRPRIFVSGALLPTFAVMRDVAKEGDPRRLEPPEADQQPINFSETGFRGAGSRTTTQMQDLAWGADVGVAIPFEFGGRQLRLKPSVGWIRYGIDLEGRVVAGLKDDHDPPFVAGRFVQFGANVREITLTGKDEVAFDGIGPGLELEMDAAAWGPLGVSLFLGAHAYRVLGDRTARFSDSVSLTGSNLPDDTYDANWSFEADPWLFRAGVGLRFHWIGR